MEGSAQRSLAASFPSEYDDKNIEEEKEEEEKEQDLMVIVPDAQREQMKRHIELLEC